ncbi:MAG TPA: hypothetical protein VJM34_16460 [Novosphingobium sp.]|nr:hypothetical protein [Novosphingobium sp.]
MGIMGWSVALIAASAISATVGSMITSHAMNNDFQKMQETLQKREKFIKSREEVGACLTFYYTRSPLADAIHEHANGRTELLRVPIGVEENLVEWSVPGLSKSKTANVRKNFPVGPYNHVTIEGIIAPLSIAPEGRPYCDQELYAWDYNVAMLHLLGRTSEIVPRSISPELR